MTKKTAAPAATNKNFPQPPENSAEINPHKALNIVSPAEKFPHIKTRAVFGCKFVMAVDACVRVPCFQFCHKLPQTLKLRRREIVLAFAVFVNAAHQTNTDGMFVLPFAMRADSLNVPALFGFSASADNEMIAYAAPAQFFVPSVNLLCPYVLACLGGAAMNDDFIYISHIDSVSRLFILMTAAAAEHLVDFPFDFPLQFAAVTEEHPVDKLVDSETETCQMMIYAGKIYDNQYA